MKSALVVVVLCSSAARVQRGGAACTTDEECELNGLCTGGACVCDRGWTGASCGRLDLLPVAPAAPVAYSGAIWGASSPDTTTSSWGGNVIRQVNGTIDLYVSEFVNHCGLLSWQRNSRIVHTRSVSGLLTGPYELHALNLIVACRAAGWQ